MAKKYKCNVCDYVYDEKNEDVAFKDLKDDYSCPNCGCSKEDFAEIKADQKAKKSSKESA